MTTSIKNVTYAIFDVRKPAHCLQAAEPNAGGFSQYILQLHGYMVNNGNYDDSLTLTSLTHVGSSYGYAEILVVTLSHGYLVTTAMMGTANKNKISKEFL